MSEQNMPEARPLPTRSGYREIITKAVCGTAKKFFHYTQQFSTAGGSDVHQVLGTAITQVSLREPEIVTGNDGTGVRIDGIFEVHIWYATGGGRSTDLIKQAINFEEIIPLQDFDTQSQQLLGARASMIKAPVCQEAKVVDGRIRLDFELGIYVEVLGETKVRVKVLEMDA
ncbi:outer spore coat protein CotE [Desulfurispora thermophila]|uniref:outer spore coat protein CotE n=1 Tax=Desulfurispora thermophila TaxID=265470 RepID=UPI00037EAB72|nr:outer spore coat protein CotE [Desulfurispora thermophila]